MKDHPHPSTRSTIVDLFEFVIILAWVVVLGACAIGGLASGNFLTFLVVMVAGFFGSTIALGAILTLLDIADCCRRLVALAESIQVAPSVPTHQAPPRGLSIEDKIPDYSTYKPVPPPQAPPGRDWLEPWWLAGRGE